MKPSLILLVSVISVFFNYASGQKSVHVPMDKPHWTVDSEQYRFENYLGVKSIYLPSGFAQLNDVVFHNGIIEFDIAFPQGRGFPGITFRIQDDLNYEEFYIRPHQSGNPDANQYTPIFNGLAGWQLYYGEGHAAAVKYNYDDWNHVKLMISGTVGEVYINDMKKPLFQIFNLKHGDVSGPISLKGNAESHFANFSYSNLDKPKFAIPVKDISHPEKNVICDFFISNALKSDEIIGQPYLDAENIPGIEWKELSCEFTGKTNVARIAKRENKKNTALVRFVVSSEQEQVKRLEFGYSDVAQVFVNGKAIYLGNNTYRSRDYRYLGTIGYFDAIFLDLKKGDNEIILAVNEAFGGWGIMARLENLSGITLK